MTTRYVVECPDTNLATIGMFDPAALTHDIPMLFDCPCGTKHSIALRNRQGIWQAVTIGTVHPQRRSESA